VIYKVFARYTVREIFSQARRDPAGVEKRAAHAARADGIRCAT
jgi:hypothetical protein